MIATQKQDVLALAVGPLAVRRITALEARTVRYRVLRPGDPFSTVVYEGDAAGDTAHFGSFEDGRLVAVASAVRRPRPGSSDAAAWCLCGVATLDDVRGRGHGRLLVAAVADHAGRHGGRLLWCSARSGAVRFYERCGFRADHRGWGGPNGRHVQMSRPLGCGRGARPPGGAASVS
jgi:GNAT superfamily N-acetyltransferase